MVDAPVRRAVPYAPGDWARLIPAIAEGLAAAAGSGAPSPDPAVVRCAASALVRALDEARRPGRPGERNLEPRLVWLTVDPADVEVLGAAARALGLVGAVRADAVEGAAPAGGAAVPVDGAAPPGDAAAPPAAAPVEVAATVAVPVEHPTPPVESVAAPVTLPPVADHTGRVHDMALVHGLLALDPGADGAVLREWGADGPIFVTPPGPALAAHRRLAATVHTLWAARR